jgi:integrase
MATIHKRRLRSGEVVWELTHGTGRERQRLVAGRTREEAQEVLKQFDLQLALHGKAPTHDSVTAVVGEYTAYLTVNRRASTVKRYDHALRNFVNSFLSPFHPDIVQLRQLRPAHLEEYKRRRMSGEIVRPDEPDQLVRDEALRAQRGGKITSHHDKAKFGFLGRKPVKLQVTARTVNLELQVLDTFFRWAIRRNYLFLNPSTGIERLRVPKRALPKFMTTEELKALFAVCNEAERRVFAAILLSGMRKGEVEHLTWSDVSFELGVVFIQAKPDMHWQPKTDERIIPMSPPLRQILEAQHRDRLSETFVFPNSEGHRNTHLLEKFRRLCGKAGIRNSTVHALRHSFGAHLRMAGVNLADIGDLLGHRDLATTQIYAKVQQEHLRKMVSKLTPLITEVADDSGSRLLPEHTPASKDGKPE